MTRQRVLAMALGFACAALAGTAAQAGPSEQAKLKQQLVDLEKRSWEAWKARDGKFFAGFLSDDHVEVGMYGRAGKSDIVDFVGSPACVVQDYVIDDFDLTVLDDSSPKGVRRPQGATLRPFASPQSDPAIFPSLRILRREEPVERSPMLEADVRRAATYFPVADVAAAGAHYKDILGFRCEYEAGEPPEFALFVRGACSIMLKRVADAALIRPNETQGGTWDTFLWVDDLDAMFAELTRSGATIVYPPTVQPYGMREFAVRDASGYVLGFGQEHST